MVHVPVMLKESLEIFENQKIFSFFDGTLGSGAFAKALLQAHPEIERYFGCDRDEEALKVAKCNLHGFQERVEFIHANFCDVRRILKRRGVDKVEGFFLI